MKKKLRFIINPKSGTGKNKNISSLVAAAFDENEWECDIVYTEYQGHVTELTKDAVYKNYFAVVVSGGDGTVHEAVKALLFSDTALAIIPAGSGNGFANHFHIPHDLTKALKLITENKIIRIDTLSVNDISCAATTGIGFDAHIAHGFSHLKTRGFYSYIKLTVKEFFKYSPKNFQLASEEFTFSQNAFLISIANTSQYGNNAYIAPHANAQDGKFDVCILKNVSIFNFPMLAIRLFRKNIFRSSAYLTFQTDFLTISVLPAIPFHIDGEPMQPSSNLKIKIVPSSLRLLVP